MQKVIPRYLCTMERGYMLRLIFLRKYKNTIKHDIVEQKSCSKKMKHQLFPERCSHWLHKRRVNFKMNYLNHLFVA